MTVNVSVARDVSEHVLNYSTYPQLQLHIKGSIRKYPHSTTGL
jgi:hypothetical protein